MKKDEAIGKKVYYMNPKNTFTIEQVQKLENYDKKGNDMFLCYFKENNVVLNSKVLNLVEDKSKLIIED